MSLSVLSWEKDHLWMYLCVMKFDALAAVANAHKSHYTRINLGVNMFDKPNKDAFYIVSHFLFEKMDTARCKDAFRFCWPPLDKKQDAEYRKVCLDWMREISDECGSGFPQVATSLFLSPGGPKFIHLMYHFARFILTHEIKKSEIDFNLVRPKSSELVIARQNLVYGRFLKACQKQDLILGDWQRLVQSLTTEIRTLKSECASVENELQKMNRRALWDCSWRKNVIKKVRSIWMVVMDTLSSLRQEKKVLDSILKGDVDLYCLDGTEFTVKIPRRLLARVEAVMNIFNSENIYEAGKMNFLTLLKVLNVALQCIYEERQQSNSQGLELNIKSIEDKIKLHEETLAALKCCSQKVKEVHMLTRDSISQKMMEWEEKWEQFLCQDPFSLMENNPTLELLPSVGPLAFESASEEEFRSSLISQYPPSVPDYFKSVSHAKDGEKVETTVEAIVPDVSKQLSSWRFSSLPMNLCTSCKVNDFTFLEEQDATMETPIPSKHFAQDPSSASVHHKYDRPEMQKKRETCVKEQKGEILREDPLNKAYNQLAKEVADAVVSLLPETPGEKGMALNEMFTALVSDPFSARKQIPRTPENLISDIQNSWRKAAPTESPSTFPTTTEKGVKESRPEMNRACTDTLDSIGASFLSKFNVSDIHESSVTNQNSSVYLLNAGVGDAVVLCSDAKAEFHHESGALAQRLDMQQEDNSLSPSDDVRCKHLRPESSSTTAAERTLVENSELEETKVEDRHHFTFGASYDDSLHTTWSWNSLQMFHSVDSSDSHEVILSIHQETLPEENTLSLNSSKCMESDKEGSVEVVPEQAACGYSGGLGEVTDLQLERKIDLQNIRSRLEQLKKNTFQNTKPDKSLTKYNSESNIYDSPAGRVFSLDLEYLKTPSHLSVDRTCSADEDFLESLKDYGQEERWMSEVGGNSAFVQQSLVDETADASISV